MTVPTHARFENYGRNVRFDSDQYHEPGSEQEVLGLLERHRGEHFRVIGTFHSWNEGPVGDGVVLNLARLDGVRIVQADSGGAVAEIGAGCTVARVIERLHEQGLTLPTCGMIGAQTIAGAVSTGTHGSGRSSMSHYITAVRIATHDGKGAATIRDLTSGPELEAARCGLGRMGIVLSVRMRCIPAYLVEERARNFGSIAELLTQTKRYPLTQFYLMPWAWSWIAQLRKIGDAGPSCAAMITGYRLARFLSIGIINLVTFLFVRVVRCDRCLRAGYRVLGKTLPLSVTAPAERVLIFDHCFRYVEMELFVPAERVSEAARFVEETLRHLGGETSLSRQSEELLADVCGSSAAVAALRGTYTHHYPITFRYVEKDSTLISMSSDNPRWAISFITFAADLASFTIAARLLALTMARAFGARPHWGKFMPLDIGELRPLLPGLAQFARQCEHSDPHRAFGNGFTERVLGF